MIAQLTLFTANSVQGLCDLPLGDLFDLYDAVSEELEAAKSADK